MDTRCGDGSKPLVSSMMDTEELETIRQDNLANDVRAPSDLGPDASIGNPGTPAAEPDIRYVPKEDTRPQPEGSDTMKIPLTAMLENYEAPTQEFKPLQPKAGVLDFAGKIDGGGVKDSMVDPENKPMMSLVPRALILGCAKVLTYGAKKYAMHNWRRGMRWGEPADALLRHFTAWMEGEDTDPESGLSHLAHCSANLAFLMHMETNYEYALMDDRPRLGREQRQND